MPSSPLISESHQKLRGQLIDRLSRQVLDTPVNEKLDLKEVQALHTLMLDSDKLSIAAQRTKIEEQSKKSDSDFKLMLAAMLRNEDPVTLPPVVGAILTALPSDIPTPTLVPDELSSHSIEETFTEFIDRVDGSNRDTE